MSAVIMAAISCGGGKEPAHAPATDARDSLLIQRSDIRIKNRRLTPEALWAMGRIGGVAVAPDADKVAYTVPTPSATTASPRTRATRKSS